MTPLQAIALGIIQGLSEFLPISSSAHLTLAPWLFGWEDPGLAFDVALHFGTLLAVLWYFRMEWLQLIKAAFGIVTSGRIGIRNHCSCQNFFSSRERRPRSAAPS